MAGIQPARGLNPNTKECFLCKICSKECSTRLSRNRHQLYCRKKLGHPTIRKSCSACRKAKIKCSSTVPICGRCAVKDITCVYEKTAKSQGVYTDGNDNSKKGIDCPTSTFRRSPQLSVNEPIVPSFFHSVPDDLEISYTDKTSFEWDVDSGLGSAKYPATFRATKDGEIGSPIDLAPYETGLLLENGNFEFAYGLEFGLYSTHFDNQPLDICTTELDTTYESMSMFSSPYLIFRYISPIIALPSDASAILARQSPFIETQGYRLGGNQLGRHLLLENIRSYLIILPQPGLFPPFIHRSVVEATREVNGDRSKFEAINRCCTVATLYGKNAEQMSDSLWQTVGIEQERMIKTYKASNESEVLAMLQAITTYILLRIFDKDGCSIEFDNQLIETMTASLPIPLQNSPAKYTQTMAIHCEKSGFLCTGEVMGHRPQWHEWILMESKRRTVILLFIVHLLYEINPGQRAKALAGISVLPLPAPRSIWEARTENEWVKEYDILLTRRGGRRYLDYADMLYLGQEGSAKNDSRRRDLNEWMLSLDSFGVLVMMAAATL